MDRQELRPCIVKIGEETETIQFINERPITKVVKNGEKHKCYFHKWIEESLSCGECSKITTYGLVEYEDGTMHKVEPECITFTDKHVISVNIDYDMIAEVAAKMMKD